MAQLMFQSILTVCTGNICRSPTAERLLAQLLPNKTVTSAGVGALVDHEADETAMKVASDHGLSLAGHRARQLTREIARSADLILVMERSHLEAVTQMVPEARGKTFLLAHWMPAKEIADPYRRSQDVYEIIYQQIQAACESWAKKLG